MNFCARYEAEAYNPVYIYLGEPVSFFILYDGENLPKKGEKNKFRETFSPINAHVSLLIAFFKLAKRNHALQM